MSSNPVIASSSGANPEIVKNGQNGFIFEEGNAKDLARKMQFFLDDNKMCEKIGEYAYGYAQKTFPSSANTDRIERLYRELKSENQ
jgi:hypothetical protein